MTIFPPDGSRSRPPNKRRQLAIANCISQPSPRPLCISQLERHRLWLAEFRMEHRRQIDVLRDAARERMTRLRAEQENEWERRRRDVRKSSREALFKSATGRGQILDSSKPSSTVLTMLPMPNMSAAKSACRRKGEWDRCLSPRLRKICSRITPSPATVGDSHEQQRDGALPTRSLPVPDGQRSRGDMKVAPRRGMTRPRLKAVKNNTIHTANGESIGGRGGGGGGRGDTLPRKASLPSLKFPPENWRLVEETHPAARGPRGSMLYPRRGLVQRECDTCPVCALEAETKQNAGHLAPTGNDNKYIIVAAAIAPTSSIASVIGNKCSQYKAKGYETVSSSKSEVCSRKEGCGTTGLPDHDTSEKKSNSSSHCDNIPVGKQDLFQVHKLPQHSKSVVIHGDHGDGTTTREMQISRCGDNQTSSMKDDSSDSLPCESYDSQSDDTGSCLEVAPRSGKCVEDDIFSDRSDLTTLYKLAKWYERYPSTPVSYWQQLEHSKQFSDARPKSLHAK